MPNDIQERDREGERERESEEAVHPRSDLLIELVGNRFGNRT